MASEDLLEGVFDVVREHYRTRMNREVPVRSWRTPEELAAILNVSVEEDGVDTDTLLESINTYLS